MLHTLSGYGKVCGSRCCQLGNLCRRALLHMQGYIGIALTKRTDDCRQCVARLGMRRSNGELAHALVGAFLSNLFNGSGLPEYLIGHVNDLLTYLGDLG